MYLFLAGAYCRAYLFHVRRLTVELYFPRINNISHQSCVCTGYIRTQHNLAIVTHLGCSSLQLHTPADRTSHCFMSGGLDYHEPIDDSHGADPPVMSCSYSLTITIPAGSSAGDGVVAIINNTIYEGPGDFFLDLSVAQTFKEVGINEGSPLRATVEIEDDNGENECFAICLSSLLSALQVP